MLRAFREHDLRDAGVVSEGVFLHLVRHFSGNVPAVDTLLTQFQGPSVVQSGGNVVRTVNYKGFVHHLDKLLLDGASPPPRPEPAKSVAVAVHPPLPAAASALPTASYSDFLQSSHSSPPPRRPSPQRPYADVTANMIMLHRQRSSPQRSRPEAAAAPTPPQPPAQTPAATHTQHSAYEHVSEGGHGLRSDMWAYSTPGMSSAARGSSVPVERPDLHINVNASASANTSRAAQGVNRGSWETDAAFAPVSSATSRRQPLLEPEDERPHVVGQHQQDGGPPSPALLNTVSKKVEMQRFRDDDVLLETTPVAPQRAAQHDVSVEVDEVVFTPDDLKTLRATFASIDRYGDVCGVSASSAHAYSSGSCVVTYKNLVAYLKKNRIAINGVKCGQLLARVDSGCTGYLDFEQFCSFIRLVTELNRENLRNQGTDILHQSAASEMDNASFEEAEAQCAKAGGSTAQTQDTKLLGELSQQAGLILQLCSKQDAARNGTVPFSVLGSLLGTKCMPPFSVTREDVAAIISDENSRQALLHSKDPIVDYIDLVSSVMRWESADKMLRQQQHQRSYANPPHQQQQKEQPQPQPQQQQQQRQQHQQQHQQQRSPVSLPHALEKQPGQKSGTSTPRRSSSRVAHERHPSTPGTSSILAKDAERKHIATRRTRNRTVHAAMVKLLGKWGASSAVTRAVVSAAVKQQQQHSSQVPAGYMKSQDFSKVIAALYKAKGVEPIRSIVSGALEIGKLPFSREALPCETEFEVAARRAAASVPTPHSKSYALVDYRFFLAETDLYNAGVAVEAEASVEQARSLSGQEGHAHRSRSKSRVRSASRGQTPTARASPRSGQHIVVAMP